MYEFGIRGARDHFDEDAGVKNRLGRLDVYFSTHMNVGLSVDTRTDFLSKENPGVITDCKPLMGRQSPRKMTIFGRARRGEYEVCFLKRISQS